MASHETTLANTPLANAASFRLKLILALAAVYVVWGSTYLAIRYAIESLPPFSMAGVRFLIAGGLLYGWARLRGAARAAPVHWRSAAVIGGLLLLGGNGIVVWAEQFVDSGLDRPAGLDHPALDGAAPLAVPGRQPARPAPDRRPGGRLSRRRAARPARLRPGGAARRRAAGLRVVLLGGRLALLATGASCPPRRCSPPAWR